jgi:anti-anti-sigma factor
MLKVAKEKDFYRVELFQVNRLNTLFTDLVREQLTELLENTGTKVIFNLKGIRFIDSEGFKMLLEITEYALQRGSEISLCNITEDVKELIILLDLEGRLRFCQYENPKEKILLVLD